MKKTAKVEFSKKDLLQKLHTTICFYCNSKKIGIVLTSFNMMLILKNECTILPVFKKNYPHHAHVGEVAPPP